ncbi:MAG: prepilin-type N-terminal cleavage/methylation domain-containing protein [Verrucomicrobia bacterium]|nr:prepilin-type N-terminal cleavage/methylation domain-containing protein [Verrucomicrobiota bacterium]
MTPGLPGGRGRGFTLIEMVISTALMALVLGGAYACLRAGLAGQRLVEPRTDVFQTARVVLDRLSADLRCACPLPQGAPFLGEQRRIGDASADNLDFATHNYTPTRPAEGDFCEQSVFLEQDPQTGRLTLWRRRNPAIAFDPLSGGRREELATGIAGLKLEYYDGLKWYDSWGDPEAGTGKPQPSVPRPNLVGLPDAVRITLLFDSQPRARRAETAAANAEPPLVFQTIARIGVPSSGSGTSTASGPESGPATPPTP